MNTTAKHTPGPWKLDIPAPKANSTTLRGANGSPIAEINKPGLRYDERSIGPIYPSEYQANAALIAAAPELLEALKSAVTRLEKLDKLLQQYADTDADYELGEVLRARDAIAKAEGR